MKTDRQLLREANELLRSAKQIANRRGEKTNWDSFNMQVKKALKEQHEKLYKKKYTWPLIVGRILALPFFAMVGLIGIIGLYFSWLKDFIWFGGEAITYTKDRSRASIQNVFDELKKQQG